MNRRYRCRDLSPVEISKDERTESLAPGMELKTLRRARWFKAKASGADNRLVRDAEGNFVQLLPDLTGHWIPFVGVDVSSSFLITRSIFLADQTVEEFLVQNSYKQHAETLAWNKHNAPDDAFRLPDQYEPGDPQVPTALNTATMQDQYGSRDLAYSLKKDDLDLGTRENIDLFLNDPNLIIHKTRKALTRLGHALATKSYRESPFKGVIIPDPLNGGRVAMRLNEVPRWQRDERPYGTVTIDQAARLVFPDAYTKAKPGTGTVARERRKVARKQIRDLLNAGVVKDRWVGKRRRYVVVRSLEEWARTRRFLPRGESFKARKPRRMPSVKSGQIEIYYSPPKTSRSKAGPYRGDYAVSLPALKDAVAPCLNQMQDALFCALVVQELHRRGVKDVVTVYDGFYVPADAVRTLLVTIMTVGEKYLRRLGVLYEALVDQLGDDEELGKDVRRLHKAWKERVKAQRWPEFRISDAKTMIISSPLTVLSDTSAGKVGAKVVAIGGKVDGQLAAIGAHLIRLPPDDYKVVLERRK